MSFTDETSGTTGTYGTAPASAYPPPAQPAPPPPEGPWAPSRPRRGGESKTAFLTTEFYAYLATVAAIVVTCLYFDSDNGQADEFTADQALRYITWLTIGYMVARGLAKAGRHQFGDRYDR